MFSWVSLKASTVLTPNDFEFVVAEVHLDPQRPYGRKRGTYLSRFAMVSLFDP